MLHPLPYFRIARPGNAAMTALAVLLGSWLSGAQRSPLMLLCLCAAAVAAAAFGNVINDIADVATDRVSHKDRPLPRGEITPVAAKTYAACLAIVALAVSAAVSPSYCLATLAPLALLALYSRFLKGTPLAGNVMVSLLVAYALLYGGLFTEGCRRLLLPALLAFWVNMLREILKDMQDQPGDVAAGIKTTAALSRRAIKIIVYGISAIYLACLPLPFAFHQFGPVYAAIAVGCAAPLHIIWLVRFSEKTMTTRLPLLSTLLKLELLIGLAALAADRVFGC